MRDIIDGGEEAIDLAGKLMASCISGSSFFARTRAVCGENLGTLAEPLAVIDEHDVIDGSLEVKRETANTSLASWSPKRRDRDEKLNYKTKTCAKSAHLRQGRQEQKTIETLLSG
jgi:hypothetical protein